MTYNWILVFDTPNAFAVQVDENGYPKIVLKTPKPDEKALILKRQNCLWTRCKDDHLKTPRHFSVVLSTRFLFLVLFFLVSCSCFPIALYQISPKNCQKKKKVLLQPS